MTNLETSITDLCQKHRLLAFSLTYHAPPGPEFYSVSLQWMHAGEREGVVQNGDTIAEALGYAIAEMQAERRCAPPIALVTEALPEFVA